MPFMSTLHRILSASLALQSTQSQSSAIKTELKETTVCEIVRQPSSFDGRKVRLRARVGSGFEESAIYDLNADCHAIWLTYSDPGPEASVSIGNRMPRIARAPVSLQRNRPFDQLQRALRAVMYGRDRYTLCASCPRYEVTATLTGRIDVAGDGTGFGHLNAYATQFVMESVTAVSKKDRASQYDALSFSVTPVRFPTGYILANVLGPDGKPVEGIYVSALATDAAAPLVNEDRETTDRRGEVRLAVAPGTYRVGVNMLFPPSSKFPFAPTFAPNTLLKEVADQFTLRDRQQTRVTIRLSRKLAERKIPVRVVWPDGAPVLNANVWLSEQGDPHSVVGIAVSHTGADGRFELVGLEGIAYSVHASIYLPPRYLPYCAESRPVGAVAQEIVLALAVQGESCRGD